MTESPHTLGAALRVFFRFGSPRLLSLAALAALTYRVVVADFSPWDLAIVFGVIAWWPFQEWLIHVLLLHFRPRKFLGFTIDPMNANKHRQHHRTPNKLLLIFVPIRSTLMILPALVVGWHFSMPTQGLAATGIAISAVLAVHYEWSHYISHIRYTPKVGYYKRLCQAHVLHHYKNEHYWFGVSMTAADLILGTSPDKASVAKSSTVKTLGL